MPNILAPPWPNTIPAAMATTRPVILDGKALATRLRAQMACETQAGVDKGARRPGLAVILAGDDHASQVYVRNKQKACAEAGIISLPFLEPATISQERLERIIGELNERPDVDGILVQLPLPAHLDAEACIEAINPRKDVDGFHPENIGRLALGLPCFVPCTPRGVLKLLAAHGLSLAGRKAVVLGRSNIVGKPLGMLLARKEINATVTICHSGTPDLRHECLQADFLFTAMGRPGAVRGDMIKPGCVVVDIGINRTPGGLVGDVVYEEAVPRAAAITPVPGGVGPMTIAMLLANTIEAWRQALARGN